jgi:primosomal protein N' (replication factor Y)
LASEPPPLVARVVVDQAAITKSFDYLIPDAWRDQARVGTLVRVGLGPRRVGGWITELGHQAPDGVALRPIAKVTGWGPSADVVDLCRWAAWRWAGRLAPVLTVASPPVAVRALPPAGPGTAFRSEPAHAGALAAVAQPGTRVLRTTPAEDIVPILVAAMSRGPILAVIASIDRARLVVARLRRLGAPVASVPRDWALAAAGGHSVIGARAAVFAPCPDLAAVVVIDEHDESLQEERTPTWHAREVAIERARRAGVPCLLVSSCPTLEALRSGEPITLSRSQERAGWPIVDIVDRSRDLPSESGPISPTLVRLLRTEHPVVCVLNRTGSARSLRCGSCGQPGVCERCHGPVAQLDDSTLQCGRCGTTRPVVCLSCGSTRFSARRPGVTRIRAELEQMLGEPVAEVTATTGPPPAGVRVAIGTEAVLHQVGDAAVVAFLDIDDELLAPRLRANELTMALLVRAARLLGPRTSGGRLVVQTRQPHHEVLQAAVLAEPDRFVAAERAMRTDLWLPPSSALATASGPGAESFVAQLSIAVSGSADGQFLIRADTHQELCDALAAAGRPTARLRLDVDPWRV